jgi:transcriptional regulator NrdR family protein
VVVVMVMRTVPLYDHTRISRAAGHSGLSCPHCGGDDTSVIDSRPGPQHTIRRRRQCSACSYRFRTYEAVGATKNDLHRMRDDVRMVQKACSSLLKQINEAIGDED